MNRLTEGRNALIARLQTITKANGYRTDAGLNVVSGWFNEVIDRAKCTFPVIVVQRAAGQAVEEAPGGLRVVTGYLVVGGAAVGLDAYEEALEDLELDILRALAPGRTGRREWLPLGIDSLSLETPEQLPPNESKHGSIAVPVYLRSVIQA